MAKSTVWMGVLLAVIVRFAFVFMGAQQPLSRRVEVATPVTSPMRLAEGYWLKKLGLSPYAGSAYHGSPLLLSLLGPVAVRGTERDTVLEQLISFLVFVGADLIAAALLFEIGALAESAHQHYLDVLQVDPVQAVQPALTSQIFPITSNFKQNADHSEGLARFGLGNVAALLYLLNPLTIAVCVGGTTSPFENMLVIMSLFGAISGNPPIATFGWAMSTHLSMYPAVLIIPITLLTICGPDRPQKKVLDLNDSRIKQSAKVHRVAQRTQPARPMVSFNWQSFLEVLCWSILWWICIMALCHLALGGRSHLLEMLSETFGFILTVEDLTPNLGLFWYFFTEVFTHFRSFFIMVFHANLLFVIVPLTIRLHHRPLFLASILVAITTLVKSYPSVGDAALTLGLMSVCIREMSGFRFSFLILYGYLFIAFLSPSMYNLWIWRGTGNANFYFAMALVYAALESILIVESVGTVIRFDRNLKKSLEKLCIDPARDTGQVEPVR